eukprot:GHVT01074014.1.p1 GENE.GHVT01074014.1~~GHVT01074014.1.p1  ORF type:complete len:171 (-),score=15.12 GHVT01074014.1:440-952(-)
MAATGHEILCGSVDGTIRVYDIRAGRLCIDDFRVPIGSVYFSNDSSFILVSCLDSCIRLVEKSTGDVLNEYRGHTNQVYRLASCLDPTDSFIVSGSEDHRLCFWDIMAPNSNLKVDDSCCTSSGIAASERAHGGVVMALAFSPMGNLLLSGGADSKIKLWQVKQSDTENS